MLKMWQKNDVFRNPNLPLAVIRVAQHPEFSMHGHAFSEIVLIQEGEGEHLTESDSHPLHAGDVLILNDGQAHSYAQTKNLTLINVLADEPFILKHTPSLSSLPNYEDCFHLKTRRRAGKIVRRRMRLNPMERSHLVGLIERLEEELRTRPQGHEAMAIALYTQIVVTLCRHYGNVPFLKKQERSVIGRAVTFIEKQYREDISLKQLEKLTFLSSRTLLRRFAVATGLTPGQYHLRVRIAKACTLLRDGSLNVTEVAYRVGFNDSNYFTRQFRKVLSVSPSEYRRACMIPTTRPRQE